MINMEYYISFYIREFVNKMNSMNKWTKCSLNKQYICDSHLHKRVYFKQFGVMVWSSESKQNRVKRLDLREISLCHRDTYKIEFDDYILFSNTWCSIVFLGNIYILD